MINPHQALKSLIRRRYDPEHHPQYFKNGEPDVAAFVRARKEREKTAASKEDVVEVLRRHEARETPAQEKAESAWEEKIEKEVGVEKEAFWQGFEKQSVSTGGALKALLAGLTGTADMGIESLARRAGQGVRRTVAPAATAGGATYVATKEKGKKE